MRHFGLAHARATRTERPDSVNDPLEGKLTGFQRFVLGLGIVVGGVLGVTTAHGYYVWFLKP
jgi:hypothetical protein